MPASKRTVYGYYGDKQALFMAVVERMMRALESAAADHFVALPLSPSIPGVGLGRAAAPSDSEMEELIVDGVRAFLRAYGPERG